MHTPRLKHSITGSLFHSSAARWRSPPRIMHRVTSSACVCACVCVRVRECAYPGAHVCARVCVCARARPFPGGLLPVPQRVRPSCPPQVTPTPTPPRPIFRLSSYPHAQPIRPPACHNSNPTSAGSVSSHYPPAPTGKHAYAQHARARLHEHAPSPTGTLACGLRVRVAFC